MKLIPLQDWAVIVPEETERTAGGLFIPDTAKEKPEQGIVESIGPGALEEEKHERKKEEKKERKFIPTIVKPGDRVLFERWSAQTYMVDNQEKLLVRERNILGLLERFPEIPASTSSSSSTEITARPTAPSLMKTEEATLKTPVVKETEREEKESAAKPGAAKKTVRKAAAKKKTSSNSSKGKKK